MGVFDTLMISVGEAVTSVRVCVTRVGHTGQARVGVVYMRRDRCFNTFPTLIRVLDTLQRLCGCVGHAGQVQV